MNGIQQLDILINQQSKLREKWDAQKMGVTKKLYSILNELNQGPVPLLPLRENEMVSIDRDVWGDNTNQWKIRKEIYFVNTDPTKNRDYDFYSHFSLYITDKHITVNPGGCGEWGSNDKGQLSRLTLIKNIFDNEQSIIDALSPLIDFSVRNELSKVSMEIDNINRAIENAQREKEKEEIKRTIKLGKYLCRLDWGYITVKDENGDDTYKRVRKYVGHEKITKICEKTVTTTDPWGYNRRYKTDQLISKLKTKSLYVVDNTEVTPPEETDSK